MASVNKARSYLTGDEAFTSTESNSICPQTHQNESNTEIMSEQSTQRLNSISLSKIFFRDWEMVVKSGTSAKGPRK